MSSHNRLSQRIWIELTMRGHTVAVAVVNSARDMEAAVAEHRPDLIVCPMLKSVIPKSIWSQHRCLIVHPGRRGDCGPSSLDWATELDCAEWGVTVLQADAELDAGEVWATRAFRMRRTGTSGLHRHEVRRGATDAVIEAVTKLSREHAPEGLVEDTELGAGRLRPLMSQSVGARTRCQAQAALPRSRRGRTDAPSHIPAQRRSAFVLGRSAYPAEVGCAARFSISDGSAARPSPHTRPRHRSASRIALSKTVSLRRLVIAVATAALSAIWLASPAIASGPHVSRRAVKVSTTPHQLAQGLIVTIGVTIRAQPDDHLDVYIVHARSRCEPTPSGAARHAFTTLTNKARPPTIAALLAGRQSGRVNYSVPVRNLGADDRDRFTVCAMLYSKATGTVYRQAQSTYTVRTPPYDRLLDELGPDGQVSLSIARRVFNLIFGGLRHTPRPPGYQPPILDATTVLDWMQHVRSKLSPHDRARMDQVAPYPPPRRSQIAARAAQTLPQASPVDYALFNAARAWLETQTHVPLPVNLNRDVSPYRYGPVPDAAAATQSYGWGLGNRATCHLERRQRGQAVAVANRWSTQLVIGGFDQQPPSVGRCFAPRTLARAATRTRGTVVVTAEPHQLQSGLPVTIRLVLRGAPGTHVAVYIMHERGCQPTYGRARRQRYLNVTGVGRPTAPGATLTGKGHGHFSYTVFARNLNADGRDHFAVCAMIYQIATGHSIKQARANFIVQTPPLNRLIASVGPNGGVSLQLARRLFNLIFGGLRHAAPPAGYQPPIPDATLALNWMEHYRAELSARDRIRLAAVLPTDASALRSRGADLDDETGARERAPRAPNQPGFTQASAADYAIFVAATDWLQTQTHVTLPGKLDIQVSSKPHPTQPTADAGAYLEGYGLGSPATCQVILYPLWGKNHPLDQENIAAHELWHCYQDYYTHDVNNSRGTPLWLNEGQAEWAGDEYVASQGFRDPWWRHYIAHDAPLFSQTYAAVGFYAAVEKAGTSPWPVMQGMLAASLHGGSAAALQAAVSYLPNLPDLLAPMLANDSSLGSSWSPPGPAVPRSAHFPLSQFSLGARQQLSVDPVHPVQLSMVSLTAPFVTVGGPNVVGEIDGQGTNLALSTVQSGVTYCVTGVASSCSPCPDQPAFPELSKTVTVGATTLSAFADATGGTGSVLVGSDGTGVCQTRAKCPLPTGPPTAIASGVSPADCDEPNPAPCELVTQSEAERLLGFATIVDVDNSQACDYNTQNYLRNLPALGMTIELTRPPLGASVQAIYDADLGCSPDDSNPFCWEYNPRLLSVDGTEAVCLEDDPGGTSGGGERIIAIEPGVWQVSIEVGEVPPGDCSIPTEALAIALTRLPP